MSTGRARGGVSRSRWQLVLAVAFILAIYLAANPTPRGDARTFLNTRVIPGLRQVDPFLVGDRIWTETQNCRLVRVSTPQGPQFATQCENWVGQVTRLPGALLHTAGLVAATGWPGVAAGGLTAIFMTLTISGNFHIPLMWPLALLLGSVLAGVVLWALKWILIVAAVTLAGILWAIAVIVGLILARDLVLRGFEIRRAIAGGPRGVTAPAAEAVRPKGGSTGR